MAEANKAKQHAGQAGQQKPAQTPGDAESPPKGKDSGTAREAIKHSDPTEPTQAARDR